MLRIVSGVVLLSPALLGAILAISPTGIAAESQIEILDTQSQGTETEVVNLLLPEHSGNSQPNQEQDKASPENDIQSMSEKLLLTRLATDDPPKSLFKRGTRGEQTFSDASQTSSQGAESEVSNKSLLADHTVRLITQPVSPITTQTEPEQSVVGIEGSTQLAKMNNKPVSTNSSVTITQAKQSFELADNYTNENNQNDSLDQVTNVTQLSDVKPTDWAYEALRSLVERYGCIVGYPDRTYRGNRALSRFEFAAGLNACLNQIERLIASSTADFVRRSDLETLQRLVDEFRAELTTLGARADKLEGRVAFLEDHQFSTTTKLEGEVIFAASSIVTGHNVNDQPIPKTPTLGYRVRLNLSTSFTGKDRLLTRLQAGNFVPLSNVTGTNEGRLEFDGDTRDLTGIGLLQYRFPISSRTNIYLGATGNGFVDFDVSAQLSPHLDGTAISLFALRNPIYNYDGGTGFGLRHVFNNNLELNLAYLTSTGANPSEKQGLFDGKYAGLAQLIVSPTDRIRIGLTYINSYSPSFASFGLATGSNLVNNNAGTAVSSNAFGVEGTFRISQNIAIDGWVGYANQRYIGRGDATVWNWAVGLTFPDLGKEGSIAGIVVGMEPKVTSVSNGVNLGLGNGVADRDTSLHVEGFYKYHFSDNIEITPGVIWLTAPNHDDRNDDIVIGVVRTVFRF
jgi:hypothetical protein